MRLAIFILLAITFASCNKNLRPFTQDMYDSHNWSQRDLQRIQFYLSEDITLTRKLTGGRSEVISGDVKVIDGEKIEIVEIPRGTPGVLLFMPEKNQFAVSFEDGSDDRYLMFGPNPKFNDEYKLLASEWQRNRGRVKYDGKNYWTTSRDQIASLLIDIKRINERDINKRTAQGRKVGS